MSDQFSTSPSNRDAKTLFADLIADYENSMRGGIDWNSDVYRKILGFIVDVARLAGADSVQTVREQIEADRQNSPVAVGPFTQVGQTNASAEAVAAAFMRQLAERGINLGDFGRQIPNAPSSVNFAPAPSQVAPFSPEKGEVSSNPDAATFASDRLANADASRSAAPTTPDYARAAADLPDAPRPVVAPVAPADAPSQAEAEAAARDAGRNG